MPGAKCVQLLQHKDKVNVSSSGPIEIAMKTVNRT